MMHLSPFHKADDLNDNDMAIAGCLCCIRGFHDRMLDEFIHAVKNAPGFSELPFRKKQKALKVAYESRLGEALQKISGHAQKGMESLSFRMNDKDVQNLWLFLDIILSLKLSSKKEKLTYTTSTAMFNYIVTELKYQNKQNKKIYTVLTDIEEQLGKLGMALADEKFERKIEEATKKGITEFYDLDVFEAAERAEFDKGVAIAEYYLKNIKKPRRELLAEKHKQFLGEEFYKMYYGENYRPGKAGKVLEFCQKQQKI